MTYLQSSDPRPLADMNTTPLIDVLLVLLIMFIITIPIQSHAVKLDLPGPVPPMDIQRTSNRIIVTEEGRILWNGAGTSLAGLSHLLHASAQMAEQPEIQLQPQPGARYALVDQVLASAKAAQVERLGFVGNEQYRHF